MSRETPLRVLAVEPESQPGGMWHYACSLAKALQSAGAEVALATILPFEPLEDGLDLPVWPLGARAPHARPAAPSLVLRGASHICKVGRLCALTRRFRPDVVHVLNPIGKLDGAYFWAIKAPGARVVYTAHEPRADTGDGWPESLRYTAADAILVHSSNGVKDLTTRGIPESKIVQIHHGNYLHFCRRVELSPEAAKRSLGLQPADRVVLFFGTIAPYKGLDALIDALGALRDAGLLPYLVVAGEPLEDVGAYRRRVHALGLTERVVFDLRYIPFAELPKYFLSADVVVFPYRRIYQSGVLQLAYGYGRPVVATAVGGVGEAVAEDGTGVVVPPGDPPALAAALRAVLSNPGMAEEMGRRAYRAAEDKYSWRAIAQTIEGVYRRVCRHSSRDETGLPRHAPEDRHPRAAGSARR